MIKKLIESGELCYKSLILRCKIIMNTSEPNERLNKDQIIEEARTLCSDYIDDRLIRSGLNLKQRKITPTRTFSNEDSNLSTRLNMRVKSEKMASMEAFRILTEKRHGSSGCNLTIDDLSKVLLYVGEVLELRHTNVYTDVLQQLNVRSLQEVNLRRLYMNVAKEIFSDGIDWAKIVSLIAFAGALAADCVLSGSSICIPRIKSWTVEYIESELVEWIQIQGGWIGLFDHFTEQERNKMSPASVVWVLSVVVLLLSILIAAMFAYRGSEL